MIRRPSIVRVSVAAATILDPRSGSEMAIGPLLQAVGRVGVLSLSTTVVRTWPMLLVYVSCIAARRAGKQYCC